MLYLGLAVAAASFWIFSAPQIRFTATPLVFVLGSLTLAVKGIFLLRKSSESLGITHMELANLSEHSHLKKLPSLPNQAAQIAQDFAAGSLFLWPLLNVAKDIDQSWNNPPRVPVFLTGLILFILGWLIRRLTANPLEHG